MSFNLLILIWFDGNKRNLPWRSETNPYKIWLSEVILQQTRVIQGIDYYNNFCAAYPELKDLAEADEQEVLKLWQGLGYYSRARNLHFSAKYILNELNGRFPDNYNELLKLKGVGEYTAAAIASIAFGEAVPAIDGNAFRVFARYFDIDLDISEAKTKKYFFELGKKIIDPKRPGDFNEAVMELGATVCLPNNPKCEICPLNESCAALAKGNIERRPVKTNKLKVKNRKLNFLEITDGKAVLMKKREKNDIWKNLYCFPLDKEGADSFIHSATLKFEKTHEEIHLLTHQKLEIHFWQLHTNTRQLKEFSKQLNAEIFKPDEIFLLPVPKPIEKYLNQKI